MAEWLKAHAWKEICAALGLTPSNQWPTTISALTLSLGLRRFNSKNEGYQRHFVGGYHKV